MFPASTRAAGLAMAMPDVCKTPTPGGPVPTPYPNLADLTMANPATTTLKVLVVSQPALVLTSMVMMSSGDEAGSLGGVVSNMIKGPARFMKGSVKVLFEGKPAIYPTCLTGQNGPSANAVGQVTVPSQATVLVGP